MHFAKNYLYEMGSFDTKVKVPLILGIWGPKGMGKTFQTELAFKKLGIEAVVMSAGELEHEWAGTPGKLIRERYRKAGDLSKVRGKMTCLMVNDIDAGLGHFGHTQVTVNNQIVIGTLMNICDDPNKVSIAADWIEAKTTRRTPIVVTGNDFSKMFAPLVRDGRMDKYYWEPQPDDIEPILFQMYKDDGLQYEDMAALRAHFPTQPLDFYGAIRSSMYDDQVSVMSH
jgi:SpoVK/Ycf46/Vps4 family AAA+-type ATPase